LKTEADADPFRIVGFEERYARQFRDLNLDWIRQSFPVEEEDERQLREPSRIVRSGGAILLALVGERVVGSCALLVRGEGELELAKLAVAPDRRGSGIGSSLVSGAIARARQLGARRITLFTSSRLTDARGLFARHGFEEVPLHSNPYEHADVAMALDLG
jgi:putative acetyltransferase